MGKRKFEPTQPGNPHKLTIKQHIFPRRCIERFADRRNFVQVRRMHGGREFELKPDDQLFCAYRAWDQRAETVVSHPIERAYNELADRIACGKVYELDSGENELVTHFLELCRNRFDAHRNPHPDVQIRGVFPDFTLDKDKQEFLEKNNYVFVRPDGTLPGRIMTGLKMQMQRTYSKRLAQFPKWGIWHAARGEFIVADNFMQTRCIPLTPNLMLSADAPNYNLGFTDVAEFNAFQIRRSREYYFARDFAECPILRRTIPGKRFDIRST